MKYGALLIDTTAIEENVIVASIPMLFSSNTTTTVNVAMMPNIHILGREDQFQRQCTVYYLYPLRGSCAYDQCLPYRITLML